jgi:transposase
LRARRDQQKVTMTSSDLQDTLAGRRAAGAGGPRSSQPKRRTFTAAYKLAIIEKYDAATGPGAKGALLRGEGLYDSHISYWRKARDSGALAPRAAAVPADAVPAVMHKGRPSAEAENERLRKRLAKAEVKLDQTRAALDIMGKAFALLELLSESADSPRPSAR